MPSPMPGTIRFQSPVTLITCAALIFLITPAIRGQHRPRLKPPKELLDVIDPDDRECVTQSGLDKSVTVQPIRLAADRSRQFLIRGSGLCLCGAQNCGFWVYRKIGHNYELLLKGPGSIKITPGRQTAKGYRDLVSQSHASANETIVRTYRYDGTQYQPLSCVNRAYYDDQGKFTRNPINRPCEGESNNRDSVSLPADILDRDLTTIDNRHLKLSDYAGRVRVVTVVASWCAPCLELIADLEKISESDKETRVIGVVARQSDPQIESVRRFTDTLNVKFPVVWEDSGFTESLAKLAGDPSTIPQVFVIDQEGHLRQHFLGYNRANTLPLIRAELHQLRDAARQPAKTP